MEYLLNRIFKLPGVQMVAFLDPNFFYVEIRAKDLIRYQVEFNLLKSSHDEIIAEIKKVYEN
jgi:hypothetical protein